jgi:hypothetical protein
MLVVDRQHQVSSTARQHQQDDLPVNGDVLVYCSEAAMKKNIPVMKLMRSP